MVRGGLFKDGKYYSMFDVNGNKSCIEEKYHTRGTSDRWDNYSHVVLNK